MTKHLRAALAAALAFLLCGAALGRDIAAPPRPLAPAEGEVIVRFKADAPLLRQHALSAGARAESAAQAMTARAQALAARAGTPLAAGEAISDRMQVVRAPGMSTAELARRLAADPQVEFAVPNGRMRRLAAPNDPLYGESVAERRPNGLTQQDGPRSGQWYLRKPDSTIRSAIDIEAAWTRTRGSANLVVAVLDTGVRSEHPDLAGRLLPGYDFVADVAVANDFDGRDNNPADPGDWITAADLSSSTFRDCELSNSSWHGTTTASLIGAATDNALGMAGAAPGVRLLPVRVLGKCFGYDSDILAAMRWAAGIPVAGVPDNPNPAKVINMSLGSSGACSAAYQAAVDEIVARGVMIVAAAGNSAGEPVGTPANCRGVMAVAALRHAGTKVGFSDLGPEIAIAAPGGNCINTTQGSPCLYPILAATNTGAQGPVSATWTDSYDITVGTSFSSPLVAGVAALVWSRQPQLSVSQVRTTLQTTARPFPTSGADNGPGDPTPVAQCQPPQAGVQQLQCYCTTALCGAGMIDAGAALAAVANGRFASIGFTPAAPTAGAPVDFSVTGAEVPAGRQIASYAWTLVDGGGIASSFSGAANTRTVSLTPTAAGSLRVRLTVTDDQGGSVSVDQNVTVAAAPSPPPASPPPPAESDSGGGAFSGGWLLLLASAVLGLRRTRRSD
jgi:serine protease